MIVYQATKADYIRAVKADQIADHINQSVLEKLNRKTSESEYRSWRNSSTYMREALDYSDIPDDCSVAIEYQPPTTSKRIDFIVSGLTSNEKESLVIVELKQWESAEVTDMDAIVRTFVGKGVRDVSHPSYQAWSYAEILNSFSERVFEAGVELHPCSFLHNYSLEDQSLHDPRYKDYIEKAPIFRQREAAKLGEFIGRYVAKSDQGKLLYEIDAGKVRPSKKLADSLASMLKGNKEFTLIDEQKIAYERVIKSFEDSRKILDAEKSPQKTVFILEGGPGTGKSVVAVNLLVGITKRRGTVQYATRNSAPREVYAAKLTGTMNKTAAKNLFRSTGNYHSCESGEFDALIIDEAHRLNAKSGMYSNLGENQIKEVINASHVSAFFIDPHQQVTLKDIGDIEEIEKWAKHYNAVVEKLSLPSQFRCGGSDGYLSWIDHVLGIQETATTNLDGIDYDFRVFDCPEEMRQEIFKKNNEGENSRMLTGYCWPWLSKKKGQEDILDVTVPEKNFGMKWNDFSLGQSWIMHDESINQIGCIHTAQGLEVAYAGVVIGPDLVFDGEKLVTNPNTHPGQDRALHGHKKLSREDPVNGPKKIDSIIKNTYRVLLTRGMKGCYVYCCDPKLQERMKMNKIE